jgi:hypothetical protein
MRKTLTDVAKPGESIRVKIGSINEFIEFNIISADKVTIPGFLILNCFSTCFSDEIEVVYKQLRIPTNILNKVPRDIVTHKVWQVPESGEIKLYICNYLNIHRNSKDKRFYMYMQ